MRVTSKGQVTIPLDVRRKLGIEAGSEVAFEVDSDGVRLVVDPRRVAAQVERLRGSGDVELTTDQILALSRG